MKRWLVETPDGRGWYAYARRPDKAFEQIARAVSDIPPVGNRIVDAGYWDEKLGRIEGGDELISLIDWRTVTG